ERRKWDAGPAAAWEKQDQAQNRKLHLQNVAAEILILHDVGKHLLDVCRIDSDGFLFKVRPLERDLVEKLFHDRVQAARPDVFRTFVDSGGEARDFVYRVIQESQFDAFGFEKRDILLD